MNKNLFSSLLAKAPAATAVNGAGGKAYQKDDRHALASLVLTGCFNGTFYASAEDQLTKVIELAGKVPAEFLAKLALVARKDAYLKDSPALLLAVLTVRDADLAERVFPQVIDNLKMLANYVMVIRAGTVGRKSLGSRPKRWVRQAIAARTPAQLFTGSVGLSPTLADLVKMVHPKPETAERRALYAWLIGRPYETSELPPEVQAFEAFKAERRAGIRSEVLDLPFQMLASLDLDTEDWKGVARNCSWQVARMNLNTFARHGVLKDEASVEALATKLRDEALIAKARVLPYQILNAYKQVDDEVPRKLRDSLADALEIATRQVPAFTGRTVVFVDVSGSMHSAITGNRKGATSKVRCLDVAALIAACVLRKNPDAMVVPFAEKVREDAIRQLEPRDSVMTNAERLSSQPGGGTHCASGMEWMNRKGHRADTVLYVSDNESWMDRAQGRGTALMEQWLKFKDKNPSAKLVCLDLQPNITCQAPERQDIFNISGFSDAVFGLLQRIAEGEVDAGFLVQSLEARPLPLKKEEKT
ncbi:MAG: hypothetical protein RL095_36 [Verrucomicrobiota bacterium]|jgi:60 kDa SS-A/Ro ribonucleoprotein